MKPEPGLDVSAATANELVRGYHKDVSRRIKLRHPPLDVPYDAIVCTPTRARVYDEREVAVEAHVRAAALTAFALIHLDESESAWWLRSYPAPHAFTEVTARKPTHRRPHIVLIDNHEVAGQASWLLVVIVIVVVGDG